MPYLNFTKITPPAPNDPLVDEAAQLNANWQHLDDKLIPYVGGGVLSGIEAGQEYFDSNFRFAVWNGSSGVVPDDIDNAWSAWTAFPVATGRVARSGFTPRWRNNSLLRVVECAGGFLFDGAASAWPMGTLFLLNGDTSGSPPLSMLPVGGKHVSPGATSLTSGSVVVAGAYFVVENPGGTSSFTRIRGQYMGGPGGGNFIMLDQLWWWY